LSGAWAQDCPFPLLGEARSRQGSGVVRRYFTRTFETPEGPYHETLLVYEKAGPGRFKTISVRRNIRPGYPAFDSAPGRPVKLESVAGSEDLHYGIIKPVVDTNLAIYDERRNENDPSGRGWPASLTQKLRNTTRNTINQTVYQWAVDPRTNDIVSGVRFTLVPYGVRDGQAIADGPLVRSLFGPVGQFREGDKTHDDSGLPLPLAAVPDLQYLGIQVPRASARLGVQGEGNTESGFHFGIGGLFVDESLPQAERDLLNAEWKMHAAGLAQGTHNPRFNYYAQNFYFMLDPLSQRAYRPWKYTPIEEYVRDGKLVYVAGGEKPPKILKDGIEWLPVEWHPESVEEYLGNLEQGKIPLKTATKAERKDHDILFSSHEVPYPFTAEAKSEMDSLFQKLETDPGNVSERIYEQLQRKIELLEVHWQELERNDPSTRQRAHHSYELAKKNLEDLGSQLRRLGSHKDPEVRKKAFLLAGSLMRFSEREPDFLPMPALVREHYPNWIVDESVWMRNATFYLLGTYPELRRSFQKDRPAPSLPETLAALRRSGVSETKVEELRQLMAATVSGRRSPQEMVDWLGGLSTLSDRRAVGTAVIDLAIALDDGG
jgi:hypothetical protein